MVMKMKMKEKEKVSEWHWDIGGEKKRRGNSYIASDDQGDLHVRKSAASDYFGAYRRGNTSSFLKAVFHYQKLRSYGYNDTNAIFIPVATAPST